ncbi:methylthioribulose-1-phosphate dehydratase [Actinokineospora alba]|uniref:Methylthioribulose-1-phosphate dehydratase n=1 Tax=Actinokineospora alba TaxID=504798 RepID=A0A1H0HBF0_9PSEU|nr:methylthioribulose 1-phosphate dehydratase [Actinokineospora alba]TDP64956.1 methylthioribulose-1-phosphate dehydratase [Actinokineospora alba]SDH50251.1 methylthioribose-1-phosphate isomerase/methylthioribulose-1-phosphate dehydratase [Actinokineospora alba]SDO16384.1 methylthioribulose-1-phosphate dehydratase [Actinokineospora alba]
MTPAEELAEFTAKLYRRGWMEGTAGNISLRLPDGAALITASGVSKGELTAADTVRVSIADSRPVEPGRRQPSAETTIHTALYRRFAGCQAVVHAHPPYATAVAAIATARGENSVTFSGLEIIKGLRGGDPASVTVPVFPNHAEVPRIAEEVEARVAMRTPPVFLIGAHGATSWGPSLRVARDRMECLETLCRLRLLIDRAAS